MEQHKGGPENSPVPISPAPISKQRDLSSEAIAEFLVEFAEVKQVQITPALTSIWQRELGHVPEPALREAFHKTFRECRFFPSPADVYERVDIRVKWRLTYSESEAELRETLMYGPRLADSREPQCDACQSTGWRMNENNQAVRCECRRKAEQPASVRMAGRG